MLASSASSSASQSSNINNLNVLTFIKDIYSSLKHIDNCFNSYKENINTRLMKLEDNHHIIIDKLTNIEQLILNCNMNSQKNNTLDSKIENELLEKINILNKANNNKIVLKPNELTFANILENNYNILDINNVMETQDVLDIHHDNTNNMLNNTNVENNTIDNNTIDNNTIDNNTNETIVSLLF